MIETPKKTLTHEDLSRLTSDLDRFRRTVNRHVIYTPGVQFLAEQCEAYLLIDAITSCLTPKFIENSARTYRWIRNLHFRLDVASDRSALVTALADTECPPFISQEIPFTDFPVEFASIRAGFDGRLWAIHLPSEHRLARLQPPSRWSSQFPASVSDRRIQHHLTATMDITYPPLHSLLSWWRMPVLFS